MIVQFNPHVYLAACLVCSLVVNAAWVPLLLALRTRCSLFSSVTGCAPMVMLA